MLACDSVHPLRKWRKDKGLTLTVCAEAIGTSRQVWSDWERGRKMPSRRLMLALWKYSEGEMRPDHFYKLYQPDFFEPV